MRIRQFHNRVFSQFVFKTLPRLCRTHVLGLAVFCTAFISQTVAANEVFKFNRNVVGFVNHNSQQSLMFISPDGKADWMTNNAVTKTASYTITNPNCIPRSQSTMTMDPTQSGMTLAYPFLVGVGWVCKIDDQTNSINFISQFNLPESPYSIVYAGEDETASYFLMNSKPWSGTGYLHLVSIQKSTSQVTTRVFAANVPAYSGAMVFNNEGVWVTAWPGKIYKISHEKIMSLVKGNTQENFLQISQLAVSGISGMSLFMLSNENSLLYYNAYDGEMYDSYTVNLQTKTQHTISEQCLPVSGYQDKWLVLCNGTSLNTVKYE